MFSLFYCQTNPLNNLRKVHKKCLELSPKIKLVFSNTIIRKYKNNLDKHQKDVNARMKIFCRQKDIGLIDIFNLKEHYLGTKKFHLNNKVIVPLQKIFYILLKVEL